MEISGSSGPNLIASPAYAGYLIPAELLERKRQDRLPDRETRIELYYSAYEIDGFPGQRINLLA